LRSALAKLLPFNFIINKGKNFMLSFWLEALFWGLLAGAALVIGAFAGYYLKISARIIALIMAFGSGVLISALAFELMDEAYKRGGFFSAAAGFLIGAAVYSFVNFYLSKKGAKHRKRSGKKQPKENEDKGSGTAIADGALLDGIPESIVIGLSLLNGGAVSYVAVTAIFLSNIPEGLSSASGMKNADFLQLRGPGKEFSPKHPEHGLGHRGINNSRPSELYK
jgi:ZIP family zinc transporter